MIRMSLLVFGTMFHTAMIACAAYVYLDVIHPHIARKFGPVPYANTPVQRVADRLLDRALAAAGLEG